MKIIYKSIRRILLSTVAILSVSSAFSQYLSDNEIKKNVAVIDGLLQKIIQLKPAAFEYDTKKYKHLQLKQGRHYGFIAEEVQSVFPELVREKNISFMLGKNSYKDASIKTIDEMGLIPLLVASVKELQQQITLLKEEVQNLKSGKNLSAAF